MLLEIAKHGFSMSVATQSPQSVTDGIAERRERGMIILSPTNRAPFRRVLFVNSYGGSDVWDKIKRGLMPPHHLWGCLELVRMGYEVALAPPLLHFSLYRWPLPHDLRMLRAATAWLRRDDILYCGHTLLYWLPLLKALRAIKCHIVSLTYAREELDFSAAHSGIIALTPAAADQARKMAPRAKIAHLSWGCDLSFFPRLEYKPQWFLSCGITHRDFATLSQAAFRCGHPLRLICPGLPPGLNWSRNVNVIDGGAGWNYQKTVVSYRELIHDHYSGTIASLVILKNDPTEYTAVGFTNLLEAMAMARPVIVTRTGAVPGEIDVEAAGCGLHVRAEDPDALVMAMDRLAADPSLAEAMGKKGRQLAEEHYNIRRYALQLHEYFQSL
jgi:glycosyltransferase involved in cell wall biosynthesis